MIFPVPVGTSIKELMMTSLDAKLTNVHVIIAFNQLSSLLQFSTQSNLICTQLRIFTCVLD
jgi:hypothetical protein